MQIHEEHLKIHDLPQLIWKLGKPSKKIKSIKKEKFLKGGRGSI